MRNNRLTTFLAAGTAAIGTLLSINSWAFTLRDDPSSSWDGSTATTTIVGLVDNANGLTAFNTTGNAIPSLDFAVPFIWSHFQNAFTGVDFYQPLVWSNALDGWHTDNFQGLATSLTIRLTTPAAGSVVMGDLADITGLQQLPLSSPCQNAAQSPSCQQVPWPTETRQTTDLVPVFSLGAFAPNQSKTFDLAFTYDWGNSGQTSAFKTAIVGYTLSPIPEPSLYIYTGIGLFLVFWWVRRSDGPSRDRTAINQAELLPS